MMKAKGYYRRITAQGIGPGGWRCPCCAPAPGKAKKLWMRLGKKKENRMFSALIREELAGDS
jgi:hypothetical protein